MSNPIGFLQAAPNTGCISGRTTRILRLSEQAHEIGLLPEKKYREFEAYRRELERVLAVCRTTKSSGKPLLVHLKDLPDGISREEGMARLPFPAGLLPAIPEGRTDAGSGTNFWLKRATTAICSARRSRSAECGNSRC